MGFEPTTFQTQISNWLLPPLNALHFLNSVQLQLLFAWLKDDLNQESPALEGDALSFRPLGLRVVWCIAANPVSRLRLCSLLWFLLSMLLDESVYWACSVMRASVLPGRLHWCWLPRQQDSVSWMLPWSRCCAESGQTGPLHCIVGWGSGKWWHVNEMRVTLEMKPF